MLNIVDDKSIGTSLPITPFIVTFTNGDTYMVVKNSSSRYQIMNMSTLILKNKTYSSFGEVMQLIYSTDTNAKLHNIELKLVD